MAEQKKATHVVGHRKLYLMVKGKLKHVTAGTELAYSAKEDGVKIMKLGAKKPLDLTSEKA